MRRWAKIAIIFAVVDYASVGGFYAVIMYNGMRALNPLGAVWIGLTTPPIVACNLILASRPCHAPTGGPYIAKHLFSFEGDMFYRPPPQEPVP